MSDSSMTFYTGNTSPALHFYGPGASDPFSSGGDVQFGLGGNSTDNTVSVPTASYNQNINPATLNPPSQAPNTSGVGGSTTLPTQTHQLPWWLNPNTVNRSIRELKKTYNNADDAFDVTGTVATLQDLINSQYGTGLQNADSAMREAQARAMQSGGQVNTSVVRGQLAREAMQGKLQGESQIGEYTDKAKQSELAAKASLAEAIARLRAQYAQQLSAYSLGKDEQQMGREEFYQTLGFEKNKFASQLQMQMRELQQAGQQAQSSQKNAGLASKLALGMPTLFSSSGTQPTFAGLDPNSNGARDTYLDYLRQLGVL